MYTPYAKRYTLVYTRYELGLTEKENYYKKSKYKSFLTNKNDLLVKKRRKINI